jgi:hypothetical protein
MYYNVLVLIRQVLVSADERALLPLELVEKITIEDMEWLNELIEGGSSNGRN